MRDLSRIIIFSLIYLILTNDGILKIGLIFLIINFLLITLNYFQKRNNSFQFLLFVGFIFLLPLTFSQNFKDLYLPTGYQYIYISIIASLIYYDNQKIDIKSSFKSSSVNSLIAAISPGTYLSGPSATCNEIEENNGKNFGLPLLGNINISNIKIAISGSLRISLGLYLNTLDPHIFNINFLLTDNSFEYKLFLLLITGFFNFWRYYLLFAGASELCKSFLSTLNINVIDNFNEPEISIFYHEIWSKWHLNITKRIKNFLYTPITLYVLRNFPKLTGINKFLMIEGMPVAVLFFVLSLWHGGKLSDIIFGLVSTFLTLFSRYLSTNSLLRKSLNNSIIIEEIIRFFSLSIFGLVLGIYSFNFENPISGNLNLFKFNNPVIFCFLVSVLIYFYYRFKILIFNRKKIERISFLYTNHCFIFLETFFAIFINLFLLIDLDGASNFIYFAN